MKRRIPFLLCLFVLTGLSPLWALDPVAPKEERAYGFVSLESPLSSDVGTLTGVAPAGLSPVTIKSGEMMRVPVGEYTLTVKMQGYTWTSPVSVTPTELTAMVVPGYGNLKVTTPNSTDMVEVWTADNRLVASFPSSEIKTLPVGTYSLKMKLGPDVMVQKTQKIVTRDVLRANVQILPNETRRLAVYK